MSLRHFVSAIWLTLLAFMSLRTKAATVVDNTLVPGTYGSAVVDAAVAAIQARCIFSQDRHFLRRLAYVESNDGSDTGTYRNGFDGGIWQVTQAMLNATINCPPIIRPTCDIIRQNLSIDWTKVQWSDLRKPLYSGLAAALYTLTKVANGSTSGIPPDLEGQEKLWADLFYNGKPPAGKNFTDSGAKATDYVCEHPLELLFILDSSGSIIDPDFDLSRNFVVEVVSAMNVTNEVRVALMTFDDVPVVHFNFDQYRTKAELLAAITSFKRTSGGTYTSLALDFARTLIFPTSRSAARRVAVLVTDGASNSFTATKTAANRLQLEDGVIIFSIGVGAYNLMELMEVASDPVCTHLFTLREFSNIGDIISEIQKSTCNAADAITSTKTINGTLPRDQNVTDNIIVVATPQLNQTLSFEVRCGTLDIYVSYDNPNPNAAVYTEKYTASDGRPAFIETAQERSGRPVYISVMGTRLPVSLNDINKCSDFNYQFSLQKNEYRVMCCWGTTCRQCTRDEYLHYHGIAALVCDTYNFDFANPCVPESINAGRFIFAIPGRSDRFIRCSSKGRQYITLCPNGQQFNQATLSCGFSTPGIGVLVPLPIGYANPCSVQNLHALHFYFAYSPDRTKFIQCDLWGNAWLQSCPAHQFWDESVLTCMSDEYLVTTRRPFTVVNPCTQEALAAGLYLHPYPCDHTKYFQCAPDGRSYVMSCVPSLFYHPDAKGCGFGDIQPPRSDECAGLIG